MHHLPDHRRALAGRTWPAPYRPADFAAIEHHRRPLTGERVASVALAVVIGIAIAVVAVHALAA